MIAQELKVSIERYAPQMQSENPLFCRARDGALGPEHLAHYLASVGFLIDHTQSHLRRAAVRARQDGNEALALYFEQKGGEERGHEQWARSDLARVRPIPHDARLQPVAAMRELVECIEQTIERDPVLHLPYMLFAEYFVTLLGPEWLRLLEERCGIPRSSMTVVNNHAELDREHAAEAFERVDELAGDPRYLDEMQGVIARTISLFGRICSEVVQAGDREALKHHASPAQAP